MIAIISNGTNRSRRRFTYLKPARTAPGVRAARASGRYSLVTSIAISATSGPMNDAALSRKHTPTPNSAIIAPPAAGPIMRAAETTVELIPIARGSDGPWTSSDTNAWRVDVSNARVVPRHSARIHTIHSCTTPVRARIPSKQALRGLRRHQQLALVDRVGDRTGPRPEDQNRNGLERHGDPERAAARRQLEHEPRLRDGLKPGPRNRDHLAREVQPVVARPQRRWLAGVSEPHPYRDSGSARIGYAVRRRAGV